MLETLEKIATGLGVQAEDFFPQERDELIGQIIELLRTEDDATKRQILRVAKALTEED